MQLRRHVALSRRNAAATFWLEGRGYSSSVTLVSVYESKMHHTSDDRNLHTPRTTSNGSPLLTKLRNYTLYGTYKNHYCLHNSPLPEKTLRWLNPFHIFTFPALYCLFHPTKGANICILLWQCWLPILCNYIHII